MKVPNVVMKCVSCNHAVMHKCGDTRGWKGLQMEPTVQDLDWYCTKEPCQAAYAQAFKVALARWNGET